MLGDVVYLCWPIASSYTSPNAGGCGVSTNKYRTQLYTGAQINFGDPPPYLTSVADPDPWSGAFLIPGSGIRNRFFLDTRSWIPNLYFWELSDNFLSKKFYILWKLAQVFSIMWNLWLPKKLWQKIFVSLLFFLDLGSRMGKNQDPGSGINIPDPQHCIEPKWTLEIYLHI